MEKTVPSPPAKKEDPIVPIIEDVKKRRTKVLTDMYGELAALYGLERDLMIYRLIKGGYVSAYQMSKVTELTPPTIYKILEKIENEDYE